MNKKLVGLKRINGPAFDSVLLAFIQIVAYAANIITTKLLSVDLSLAEYGTYSTINTVITIAASLTLFGLGDAINYYYNKNSNEKTEYVNTIFFVQLVVGVTVAGVLALMSGVISDYYGNILVKPLIIVVCIKPWISNATHLYQVLFVSSGKAKLIAVRNLIISVLKVILVYVSVKIFDSLTAVFICLVLLDGGQLIAFRYIFGKIRFRVKVFSFSREKMSPVVRYALPMGVYFVTTTLMREIDKLVVGRLGTTEELAVYANCAKALPLNILITAFATVLIPYIMKNVSAKNYRLTAEILNRYLTMGYLSVWMFSGALLLCAPEAIRFFYAEEYIAGLPVFVVYILDGMVQFAGVHLVIAANGDSGFLMKTSLILLGVNGVSSVVLYKLFGAFGTAVMGPAVATLLISVIYVRVSYKKTAKILGEKIRSFLPVRHMAVYLCQLAGAGVVFAGIKHGLRLINVPWVVIFISVCGCYCLAVALINMKKYKTVFNEINKLKQS